MGWIERQINEKMGLFCVRICVRKTFQNLLKSEKMGKSVEFRIKMISNSYYNFRRLGNSGILTSNP